MNDTTLKNGQGVYPYYDALWHLDATGVRVGNDSAAWDMANEDRVRPDWTPVKVALIDTSVAWEHPNLKDVIDRSHMIDFFAARLGAFPERKGQSDFTADELPGKAQTEKLAKQAGTVAEGLLAELIQRLQSPSPAQSRVRSATSAAFSAHGTAMAGLIGARPVFFENGSPVFLGEISPLTPGGIPVPVQRFMDDLPSVLPYAGVNPYCSIVPISTNLELDPEQMILALLYTSLIGADVIALPRDIADPTRFRLSSGTGLPDSDEVDLLKATHPVSYDLQDQALWNELNTIIMVLSERIPIVAASGNGSDNRVIYPASISDKTNGIISVGAQAATGQPSGYSPDKEFVDVFAPSGDGERLDTNLRRLDTLSTDYRPEEHSSDYVSEVKTNLTEPLERSTYAIQDLITTDVPGRFGYNGSDFVVDDMSENELEEEKTIAITDFGSYFCSFSGTSGAVGVAAGFLSLAFAAGHLPRGENNSGVLARALMRKAAGIDGGRSVSGAGSADGLHWSRI